MDMNPDDLTRWMTDPRTMNGDSYKELTNLLELYPYFQAAHVLALKVLHDNNSIRFEEEQKHSSIYVGDRRQLFLLLNDMLDLPLGKEEDQSLSVQVTNTTVEKNSGETQAGGEERFDEIKDDTIPDKSILSVQELLEIGDNSNNHKPNLREKEDFKENIADNKDDKVVSKEDMSLDFLSFEFPSYDISQSGNLYTLDQSKDIEQEVSQQQSLKRDNQNNYTQHKHDLIESFIQNDPRIIRNDKVSDKQQTISVERSVQDEGFMSETLAKIYVKQKLYEKAIGVYEKLRLKNPEKNAYFVSQIERINMLMNSK